VPLWPALDFCVGLPDRSLTRPRPFHRSQFHEKRAEVPSVYQGFHTTESEATAPSCKQANGTPGKKPAVPSVIRSVVAANVANTSTLAARPMTTPGAQCSRSPNAASACRVLTADGTRLVRPAARADDAMVSRVMHRHRLVGRARDDLRRTVERCPSKAIATCQAMNRPLAVVTSGKPRYHLACSGCD
jgi:hypothetical protein